MRGAFGLKYIMIGYFGPKNYRRVKRLAHSLTHLRDKAYRVHFVGHWQTVQNQIRRRKMRCLIRFSTVCLQKFLLKND